MGKVKLPYVGTGGKGGDVVNSIIEQYKVQAGSNVNAGDFVEFVSNISLNKTITSDVSSTRHFKDCLWIDDTSALVVYYPGTGKTLYGRMFSVVDNNIVATSNEVSLLTASSSLSTAELFLYNLDSVSILLMYRDSIDSYNMKATILIHSGNTSIARNGTIYTVGGSYASKDFNPIVHNAYYITIFYGNGNLASNPSLYGQVLYRSSVASTTLTIGSQTQIAKSNYQGWNISPLALNLNEYIVYHRYSTNQYTASQSRYYAYIERSDRTLICKKDQECFYNGSTYYFFDLSNSLWLWYSLSSNKITIRRGVYFDQDREESFLSSSSNQEIVTDFSTGMCHLYYPSQKVNLWIYRATDNTYKMIAIYYKTDPYRIEYKVFTLNGDFTYSCDEQGRTSIHLNSDDYHEGSFYKIDIKNIKQVNLEIDGIAKSKGTSNSTIDAYTPTYK